MKKSPNLFRNSGFIAGLAFTFLPLLVPAVDAQSPTLGITNDSTEGVSVFWPVVDGEFSLLWTPSAGTPIAWQSYPVLPSLSGDGNYLVVALASLQATNPVAFFQLVSNAVVVPAAPSVVTVQAYPINTTSTELYGTVLPNGLDTTWWFQWGLTTSYGNSTTSGVVGGSNTAPVEVVAPLAGLSPGTTYNFQLYGSNVNGVSSGGNLTFTTAALLPDAQVETYPASNVTSSTALLSGSVNPNGSTWVGWFEWGATTSYGNRTLDFPGSPPNFQFVGESDVISNLAPNTTYHCRIVAFNGGPDEAQGNDVMFTTSTSVQQQPPIVTTLAASNILASSAYLNASINGNGADTTSYFQYSNAMSYIYISAIVDSGSGNSILNSYIGILLPNTTYYYRVVAYNSGGVSEGAVESFTTPAAPQAAPTVETFAASSVTATSAILNAVVNPNGAATSAAFLYGTTSDYGMSPGTFPVGSDNSFHTFLPILTNLTQNTTYHYTIQANNSGGTSNGADVTFTTGSVQYPPLVATLSPSGITGNYALLNGLVNPNGLDTHTYFQWGATTSYGNIAGGGDVGMGTSLQSDVFAITDLTPLTQYHYRLIGSNSVGTNAGVDVPFTTSAAPRPLGIDVSQYQNTINWTSVQTSGVTFAFAKANEGITITDATFTNNVTQGKAAGVLMGAYHFAHPELHLGMAGADACAAQFWNVAGSHIIADGKSLMPVLDYETDPGSNYTQATSSQWVNEWCQDIVNYGVANGVVLTPIVYTYNTFATEWLNSTVTQWPVWMGNPNNGSPQTGAPDNDTPWSTWNFWQYNQFGSVPGVSDQVDLDVFNGSATDLQNYVVVPL